MRLYGQARSTTDNFELERIDRALDEIVRLNSTDSYGRQVRSAMANALKVLRTRRNIAPPETLGTEAGEPTSPDSMEAVIDLRSWLGDTKHVTEQQRMLLTLLADDYDADAIAALYRIPARRVRERIARARKASRAAYDTDMNTASPASSVGTPPLAGGEPTGSPG
jgi:DNA-directed RNA polymerase specialized sigma24 family protein